jgi:cytochrome o ubiquinol oxidase operon protein cyoD
MVQLVFFLHLGGEGKPRWRLTAFLFMLLVLVILVFGSLWIMYNLDYHMTMSPEELDSQIIEDEGY